MPRFSYIGEAVSFPRREGGRVLSVLRRSLRSSRRSVTSELDTRVLLEMSGIFSSIIRTAAMLSDVSGVISVSSFLGVPAATIMCFSAPH